MVENEVYSASTDEEDSTSPRPDLYNTQNDLNTKEIHLSFTSFGFSLGQPPLEENVYIWNLQNLTNPAAQQRKNRTGLDKDLQREIFQSPQAAALYESIKGQIQSILDSNQDKEQFNFKFGCFAGKHRSVAFVERISRESFKHKDRTVIKRIHRDLKEDKIYSKKGREKVRAQERRKKYNQE